MKRSCFFAVLMMLGSPVYAADSISFVVGGHRIHIEAQHHCNSLSCVSVSIPGIYQTRRARERYDDGGTVAARTPPAPTPVSTVSPASKPPVQPVICAAPPPPARPAAPAIQPVVAPPQPEPQIQPPPIQPLQVEPPPPIEPVKIVPASPPQPTQPVQQVVERPAEVTPPIPAAMPHIIKASQQVEDEPADTPLGDWQTEGKKGTVRIERCGQSLCGYVLDLSSSNKGDTVLIDMKPKSASEWSGNVYSRDSGNTYYGTIAMKGPNLLRVEACAIGKFWCSGNDWGRIDVKTAKLISSRQTLPEPRS
ncbi:DUF2147 domain-containing protein [Bradyrhizobium canariense]|uniref:DUF2147 domain-containing protein n=1 Tax=Bradyrhizobium canariense TaxID=255045 RepID=A0A1H1VY99_9BRAD|nr:DUF2147 domain-containing protein [Bradyrhizobium canariense]SDS89421.1 hypothetical protein SAMN05444158_3596 [Bradyrhizobium canariense]